LTLQKKSLFCSVFNLIYVPVSLSKHQIETITAGSEPYKWNFDSYTYHFRMLLSSNFT